jgi:branched-chain amino acid transport system substrate-binding protein
MIAKKLAASLLAVTFSASIAGAQETINVGFIAPLTGLFGPSGKELLTGARLYMQQHGGVLDEYLMDDIGDSILGVVSAFQYSDAHPSDLNRRFVTEFQELGGIRPNFMGVSAYDGMALIYKALEKTHGETDGIPLFEAMKGLAWESPRGPIAIDPQTREIVQNVYIRKVDRVDGHLKNIEFETFPNGKDPSK